jgi:hypothetical protein
MKLITSTLEFDQLIKQFVGPSANAGAVTVLAALTEVTRVSLTQIAVGDLILINYSLAMTKGGVAGSSYVSLEPTLVTDPWGWDFIYQNRRTPDVAAGLSQFAGTYLARVTSAGDFVGDITLNALSTGSNSTVAIGNGLLSACLLRG